MESKAFNFLFKFVMVGDIGVGKSSLIRRFADDEYDDEYVATIGVDFRFRTIQINGKKIKIQIWDTAGQEKFKSVITSYLRGADGVIICYDLADQKTFEHVENWILEIKSLEASEKKKIVSIIVGNKADLIGETDQQYIVPVDVVKKLANKYGVHFFEASAKKASNVETVFISAGLDLMHIRKPYVEATSITLTQQQRSHCCSKS